MVGFGILGGYDDWMGLVGANGAVGLLGRYKILVQIALALVIALVLYFPLDLHSIAIPTIAQKIDIGPFYIPLAVFIIVGASNAVNFTDGLDSLAGWVTGFGFAVYGMIAYLQQQIYLVTFCFIMVGALLAFLWYNAHPAELLYGRRGVARFGLDAGGRSVDERSVAIAPISGNYFCRRSGVGHFAGGLFQS